MAYASSEQDAGQAYLIALLKFQVPFQTQCLQYLQVSHAGMRQY
jgi:hypothetical protein